MDEFEDEESDSDVVAMVTKYLPSSERPTDAERADPLATAVLEEFELRGTGVGCSYPSISQRIVGSV